MEIRDQLFSYSLQLNGNFMFEGLLYLSFFVVEILLLSLSLLLRESPFLVCKSRLNRDMKKDNYQAAKIKNQECVGKREQWKREHEDVIDAYESRKERFRNNGIKQINCAIINWTNCCIFSGIVFTICLDDTRFL